MTKWVYSFGDKASEGNADMAELLGGKGANLAEMAALGLPVPPGLTISTAACGEYFKNGNKLPTGLEAQIATALEKIEAGTGRKFGSDKNPLLLAVRSGARASLPGMMDTVLNLGLNESTVIALAKTTGDQRFAYDCYRRLIQMYGDVVLGVDHDFFEEIIEEMRDSANLDGDADLSADQLAELIPRFKQVIKQESGEAFPEDPSHQLLRAVEAVFGSWNNQRAIIYRQLHHIPHEWGTAVNIQAMVFGNMGQNSATGVAFTRNPSTGEQLLYGEFLVNAQGEDVVAGLRTPQDITEVARIAAGSHKPSLEKLLPEAYDELLKTADRLERHYRDMQDLEFTIEDGKLWVLQTRSGKRTVRAALCIAVDMAQAGAISKEQALMQIDPYSLDHLLHPNIAPGAKKDIIASGLHASPGAACGQIVFDPDEAAVKAQEGKSVILVRVETSPEDIHGMHAAKGILTQRGGMTSHAAVVARGMGKPCVAGAGTIRIDTQKGEMTTLGRVFRRGDIITIDGTAGEVLAGEVPMEQPELSGAFGTIMQWADQIRRMDVRANAETPPDAQTAKAFGAQGIGLCRTEHMFFEEDRISAVRKMILADDLETRQETLEKLLPIQRADFEELFEIMTGQPVTIRLLDPPFHEFLPKNEDEIVSVAASINVAPDLLRQRISTLFEFNPMLGHRGCRLAISYPEVTEMQARAIFEAAINVADRTGKQTAVEIMVPLVSLKNELDFVKDCIDGVAAQITKTSGKPLDYTIGTMIELPRAAIRAGDIAQSAEFFSFGTNDLTQTTFGISRDDASQFLNTYQTKRIVERDPFVSIDVAGVGGLMEIACERGRQANNRLAIGICGEHGGDPQSIEFCERIELDYVSCSPFRIPIARLAAAQASIRKNGGA